MPNLTNLTDAQLVQAIKDAEDNIANLQAEMRVRLEARFSAEFSKAFGGAKQARLEKQ